MMAYGLMARLRDISKTNDRSFIRNLSFDSSSTHSAMLSVLVFEDINLIFFLIIFKFKDSGFYILNFNFLIFLEFWSKK